MKNLFAICYAFAGFLLTGLAPAFSQTPAFAWAKQATGPDGNYGKAIAIDAAGNSYVTGYFEGTATFGTTSLTSSGGKDVFVVKYDGTGTVIWAVKGGGLFDDLGWDIAVDGSGNSYVTGEFMSTATFGGTTLTGSFGTFDMFTVKYNASGAVVWAIKGGGGAGFSVGSGIAVDGMGNSYVTGNFAGAITLGTTTLNSAGNRDMFTVKFDTSGTLIWAVQGGGTGSDSGNGIAVDGSGNSYVTGSFADIVNFGTTTLNSTGNSDMFIVKYNASGAILWAEKAGGSNSDYSSGITVDGSGNCYITGEFSGTATFGTTTLASTGTYDMFTVKYNASGAVVWAIKGGGVFYTVGSSIAVDGMGSSYVTGNFFGTATLGTTTLTSTGFDMFTVKYDASGTVMWAVKGGGLNNDFGRDIAVDGIGNSYVTGEFSGTATFGATTLTNNGPATMFITKLESGPTTGVTAMKLPGTAIIYPNPNNGMFNLELNGFRKNEVRLTAYDVTGKQVLSKPVTAVNGAIVEKLQLPDQKGIYLLKVVSDRQVLTRKILVE